MAEELKLALTVPAELNPDGLQVRVAGTAEEPLWCLADVCRVLTVENVGNVAERLDDDEKSNIRRADVGSGQSGGRPMVFVTEPGLYKVILRSDKPNARAFTRWVTHDVLPCIRRHGCYPAPSRPQSRTRMLVEMAQAMLEQEERLGVVEGGVAVATTTAQEARCIAQAAMDTHTSNYGYYTILGYWKRRGWAELSYAEAAQHGRAVTAICEGLGATINPIADPRFGRVNSYPEHVLEEYFSTRAPAVAAS